MQGRSRRKWSTTLFLLAVEGYKYYSRMAPQIPGLACWSGSHSDPPIFFLPRDDDRVLCMIAIKINKGMTQSDPSFI